MMNTGMPNSTSWNIKRRRNFAQLQEGTQVPGYCGYIEQFKYHEGDTYGNATHKLSKMRVGRHPIISSLPESFNEHPSKIGTGLTGSMDMTGKFRDLKLPKSTGDNKLTEKMVPGYTGYIPRMPFKFGNTYKEDCDVCIDDFLNNTKNRDDEVRQLQKTVLQSKTLKPITNDKFLTQHLNEYRDRNPTGTVLLADRKHSREAPMPGYQGFIPRQGVTELGLGARYNTMCAKSLNNFYDEKERHKMKLDASYRPQPQMSDEQAKASLQLTRDDREAMMQRRLYKPIGMVPKYTGYLPQIRFQFGNTYGNTSRSLPVCLHDKPTFGEYIATGGIQQAV